MAAFRNGGRDTVTHSKVFKDVQSYSKGFRKKMMRHLKIQSLRTPTTMRTQTIWPAIPPLPAGEAGVRENHSTKNPLPFNEENQPRTNSTLSTQNSKLGFMVAVREDLCGLCGSVVKSAKIREYKPKSCRYKAKFYRRSPCKFNL
jgi:hypothetical protein